LTPIFIFIILYVCWNVYKKIGRTKINLPPGSYGWPFLGESLALLRAHWDGVPERFVQERIEKHGSPLVFKTSLLGEHMAVLCGPAGNKFVFRNENKLVAAWWPLPVTKLMGKCLITSRGDEAKWMRKMLLLYLGPDAFATHYAATMDAVTRRHIEIYLSVATTHKDMANFKNVTRFDPSRFEGAGPIPFTYVPFGGGPRMCLGKEFARLQVLAFLHNIVTNFNWELLIPDEKIEYDPMPTPVKGLPIPSYILWNVYNNHKTKRTKINLPPGSFGWPFLGESLALLRAWRDGCPERFVEERIEKHGSPLVFKTSLLGERMAVMCGPAGNKFLFGNENKLVGLWWPSPVTKLFGKCLITSRGDEAKWMRKILLSYLGPDALATHYAATMDVVTRQHIEKEVKVFQIVKLYAFELACRLFMSLEEPNHIAKLGSLFNIFLKGILELPINIPGTRVELEEGKASSSQDLLSHLLTSSDENRRYLTEKDIANNILLLLFAGHDTSTVAITLLIKSLGEHPDVYNKVLKEQLEISKAKEAEELLKWEDIQKMKYSWNVVSEVMRLNPPATGAFREALVDIEYAGYTIPKGW
ncbi:hypothetical protein M8C21_011645, partial [Ambrosia artemisiifolia]